MTLPWVCKDVQPLICPVLIVNVLGIPFMHRCGPGWVDRDISAGNILLLPSTDMAKLADLEYAKRLDDMSSKGIRTV